MTNSPGSIRLGIRIANNYTMRYTVMIEDPKPYTRPWSTSYIYRVNPGTEN